MVICECGKQEKIKTSWTDRKHGRRFYCCPTLGSNCGFIGRVDPLMCHRVVDVIPDMLKARNELEDDMEEQGLLLREKELLVKKLMKHLVIAWILVFVVVKNF
ncbi:zinc finger, GRF-type [Artemisia annua]|uniref:Zinc finger, GRF-type n=1 Tax=Artemisia annua TaxID=35608 RepID=A0A2U1NYT8_ARTAN|nr:zinc finger, GRF-type [Artemisia annua]